MQVMPTSSMANEGDTQLPTVTMLDAVDTLRLAALCTPYGSADRGMQYLLPIGPSNEVVAHRFEFCGELPAFQITCRDFPFRSMRADIMKRMPGASHLIYSLASPDELAAELGTLVMLTRTIRGMQPGDLAKASGSSLEDVERIESGQGGDLAAFLRIAQALKFRRWLDGGLQAAAGELGRGPTNGGVAPPQVEGAAGPSRRRNLPLNLTPRSSWDCSGS